MKASICVLLVAVGMAVAVEESANYDMIIAMIKAGQTPVKAFLASVDAPMNAAVQNFAKFNATCRSDLNSLKRGCKGCAMDMCEDRHEEVCGRRASFSNVDRSSEKFWDVIFPQRFEPMFVKSLVVDMVGGGQVDLASNSGSAFKAPAAAGGGLTGGTSSLMSLIGGGGGAGGLEALLGGLGGGAGGDGAGGLSSLLDGLKGDTGGDSPLGGLSSLLGGFGKRADAAPATTAPTCQQFARDPVNVCSYYLDKGECDAECWFDPDTYYSKNCDGYKAAIDRVQKANVDRTPWVMKLTDASFKIRGVKYDTEKTIENKDGGSDYTGVEARVALFGTEYNVTVTTNPTKPEQAGPDFANAVLEKFKMTLLELY